MSKFAYKAEGELDSVYLLDLLKEYLNNIHHSNDTKGIVEDDYNIDVNKSRFSRWIKDKFKRISYSGKDVLDNYNKVLSCKYVNKILDKIDIYLQTNVLTSKQFFELKSVLKAIKFDKILPMLDEFRSKAIIGSQHSFLKVLNDIKYLQYAGSNYVLFNSPVNELKPFLSDKVSLHQVNYIELQKLVEQFVDVKYCELNNFEFDAFEPAFTTKLEDFYQESITDNGIGEEVEKFIRGKMKEKLDISKNLELLQEEQTQKINEINALLKRLKVLSIEKMMYKLIVLKTNQAQAKEVIDKCKEEINSSTICNKPQIFLAMDNLYYKLSKQCETLQEKIKLKLQLVDKQKMFATIEMLKNTPVKSNKKNRYEDIEKDVQKLNIPESKAGINTLKMNKSWTHHSVDELKTSDTENDVKPSLTENLYDDDDGEIVLTEDEGDDIAEDEIIIDDSQE